MAGRGPAPKDAAERRRRNVEPDLTVIEPDGQVHGPELPDEVEWPDVTRAWWETWRRSPQARTFTDTDWSFLLDTAVLHMEFWDGNRAVAGELRLRAAKFGATPEDRARLKIAIGDPSKKQQGATKQTKKQRARRSRILEVVADADAG